MASRKLVSAGRKVGGNRLERVEEGKQRKLEISGEMKCSQKERSSQRTEGKEEITGRE